jgi:hypothetical protein
VAKQVVGRGCFVVAALTAALLGISNAAAAETDPATSGDIQVQAGARYGIELTSSDFKLWQTGYGFTVGRTADDNGLYVGGSFDWYVGERYHFIAGDVSSPEVGGNYWQGMGQVGFDRALSRHWLWRPKVGAGVAGLSVNKCVRLIGVDLTCQKTKQYTAALMPTAELIYDNGILLSLEARYALLFDTVTIRHVVIGSASIGGAF